MPDDSGLTPALTALTDADRALTKLDKMCCDPGRSPRMQHLGETLADIRARLSAGAEAGVLDTLEDAGAQVGRLQVGCCAPKRLPLYSRILEDLTAIQLTVSKELGQGH